MTVKIQKHSKAKQDNSRVAQRQRWLYAYTVVNIFSLAYGYLTVLHTSLPAPAQSPYFSASEMHAFLIQGLIYGAVLEIATMIYLISARNIKHVLVLMYVLLALNILALPDIFFFKMGLLREALTLFQTTFTAVMIKLLLSIKRKDAKRIEASKSKTKTALANEPESSSGWRVTRKVIRVIFRVNTIIYGSNLIWVSALLLGFEHDRLTIERLFTPFIVLGIIYAFPYYLLKGKQLAAYVGSILLVTTLTILSLHIPVHVGKSAPAYLPFPSGDLTLVIFWMFFHLSPAYVVYAILICFDATAEWTKRIARVDENKRAAVTLFWVLLIVGSLFLGSIVRTHTAPPAIQTVPQQLVTFTSSEYKFKIGFPGTPSATNATEQASSGNMPVPYTQFNSHVSTNAGLGPSYNVYAYNWPEADGSLTNFSSLTDLKSSLEEFANNDIATAQGNLISTKIITLDSGKKFAIEDQYTVNQQYYGKVTEYVRVVINGQYEYDIQASGISRTNFEAFANSFQFLGSIIPDISSQSSTTDNTQSDNSANHSANPSSSSGSTPITPTQSSCFSASQSWNEIGQNGCVEFTVGSTYTADDCSTYISQYSDFMSGFSILVPADDCQLGATLAAEYANKTVDVSGSIISNSNAPEIEVTSASQIQLAQ